MAETDRSKVNRRKQTAYWLFIFAQRHQVHGLVDLQAGINAPFDQRMIRCRHQYSRWFNDRLVDKKTLEHVIG